MDQKNYKIAAALLLCCLVSAPAYAFDEDRARRATAGLTRETAETFLKCNKWLAAAKGVHGAGEMCRISCMQSTNKEVIQAGAIASVLTSALVIGMKLFAAGKQKWVYDIDPVLYIYPILSVSRTAWDLVKALRIAYKAKTFALNNKKNNEKTGANNYATGVLMGLVAAETAGSLYSHKMIHDGEERIEAVALANAMNAMLPLGVHVDRETDKLFNTFALSLLSKGFSFIMWAIRQGYESRYLNTDQFVADLEKFDDDDEEEVIEKEDIDEATEEEDYNDYNEDEEDWL